MDGIEASVGDMKVDDPQEVRDRRLEVIRELASFPSLKQFFTEVSEPIEADGDLIALLKPNVNPSMTQWMGITEVMASTFYNQLTERDKRIAYQDKELAYLRGEVSGLRKRSADLNSKLELAKELATANKTAGDGKTDDDDDGNVPIQHPKPFSGDTTNKADRPREYQAWRDSVRGFWVNRAKHFRTERAKLIYLSSVLTGSAYQGVSEGLAKVAKFPDDQTRWQWLIAEDVITELDKKYDTYDLQAAALEEWNKLEMAGDYADYNDFIAKFIDLTTTLKYNDETRVTYFEQKITRKLREAIYGEPTLPNQGDFDEWVELGRKYWHRLQRSANINKTAKAGSGNGNPGSNNGTKKPEQAGEPMDLDSMKLAIANIPQEERERRLAQGLCMNCGLPGHFARQCKKKTNANAPRGRSGFGFNPRGGRGRGGRGGFFNNNQGGAPGGYNNGGYSNQGTPNQWHGYQGFNGNAQGGAPGGFGRGGAPPGGFGRGGFNNYGNRSGHQQLRFADTPAYIPNQSGFVVGEVESEYGNDFANNNASHGNLGHPHDDTQQQGNA